MKFKEALDRALISWIKQEKGVDVTGPHISDDSTVRGCHCCDGGIDYDTTVWYTTPGGRSGYVTKYESLQEFLTRLSDIEI